ncbi:MAG: FAD-dependent oxidoreductase [Aeromicrobium sp.]
MTALAPPSPGTDLSRLFESVTINGLVLDNRITQSAHHPLYVLDGAMTDRYVAYFAARAAGGASLLVTGSASVHRSGGTPRHLAVWREESLAEHRVLADAVHEHGSRVFVQLWHGGPQISGSEWLDRTEVPLAASAVPSPSVGRIPKAMDEGDIAEVVRAFGEGAAQMQEAGIDGVELNGAHGYLIHSFLSPLTNLRTDGYGGDAAGRTRLLAEIVAEIRRTCGPDYPLGLRMMMDEYIGPAGIQPDTAAANLTSLVASAPVDYVSLSAGSYHSFERQIPTASSGLRAPLREHGAAVRRIVGPQVPVMLANSIRDPDLAVEVVERGEADLVAMTRAQIADPDLVEKLRTGRRDEVRRCIGANQGCIRRVADGNQMACTVNPHTGRESIWPTVGPPERTRSVLVVGGGPAGLKAAATAARRGHRVRLVEREAVLGGQAVLAGRLGSMRHWNVLVDDLVADAVRAGVEIVLGTTIAQDSPDVATFDDVIVATGSSYDVVASPASRPDRRPEIAPGADVVGLDGAVADLDRLGRDVVIADDLGDHAALSLALELAGTGRQVTLVTPGPVVGPVAAATGDLAWMLPHLAEAGVVLETGTWPVRRTRHPGRLARRQRGPDGRPDRLGARDTRPGRAPDRRLRHPSLGRRRAGRRRPAHAHPLTTTTHRRDMGKTEDILDIQTSFSDAAVLA